MVILIGPAGGKRVVVEFVEADDNKETGDLIAVIKGKNNGGAAMYDPTDDLPEPYSSFRVQTYRDRIDYPRSYEKLAVVAHEDDFETMLNHALIQVQTRGLDR